MKNLCILCCLLLLAASQMEAQCLESNKAGIHVVQTNENLYKISRKYGVSVNKLCQWNNMRETDILTICRTLIVSDYQNQSSSKPTTSDNNTTSSISDHSKLQKQAGNRHVVQPGETTAGLARLYGYTEERFREFNAMGNEELTAGSIVLSHDCACDRVMYSENGTPSQPDYTSNYKPETTTYYDKDPVRPLISSPKEKPSPTTSNPKPSPTSNENTSSEFMKAPEMEMVNEINLMRADPAGYVKYINEYVADQKANNGFPIDQKVVDELNAELRKLSKLSQLTPKECVYIAAKKHGQDIIKMGRTDHVGSDGKWPWDRVRRECPDLTDGNENLVGGPSVIRESVIILLIDEGIPNRGHRKTLLREDWKYVACYNIGKVGMMPNCWVQKFGF